MYSCRMPHVLRKALPVGGEPHLLHAVGGEPVPHLLHDMLAASELGKRRVGVSTGTDMLFRSISCNPTLAP